MRCIGSFRFTLWALMYLVCPRRYYGTLSYSSGMFNNDIKPQLIDELDDKKYITEDCMNIL